MKLQDQIGLVAPEIEADTNGRIRVDPEIRFSVHATRSPAPEQLATAFPVILAETARLELINYDHERHELDDLVEDFVVIEGGVDEAGNQRTGREDLFVVKTLDLAAQGSRVLVSSRLRINRGGAPSDVLEEWLGTATAGGTEKDRREQLLAELTSKTTDAPTVFAISHFDLMLSQDQQWFIDTALPRLRSVFVRARTLLTVQHWELAPPTGNSVRILALGRPVPDEVKRAFRRFGSPKYERALAEANYDYDHYKTLALSLGVKYSQEAANAGS